MGKRRTIRGTVKVKVPGGRVVVRRVKNRVSLPSCSICGAPLAGVPRVKPNKLAKTEKRPERPFGGVLCAKCSKKETIERFLNKITPLAEES